MRATEPSFRAVAEEPARLGARDRVREERHIEDAVGRRIPRTFPAAYRTTSPGTSPGIARVRLRMIPLLLAPFGARLSPVRLGMTGPVLIGRAAEVARLDALVTDLLDGHGGLVLIDGEAGVGKTRLVAEAVARAHACGVTAATGHCVDLGEGIWPLAAPREIVGGLLADLDDENRDEMLGPGRAVLGRLLPELGVGGADDRPLPAAEACELLTGVLRRVAGRTPLLVVVEDLHSSGPVTQMMVTTLTRPNPAVPVLVLGTYRSDELHAHHAWRPALGELLRAARPERISLQPFDRPATAAMVTAIVGAPANQVLVAAVHARSGGNAFFIEELVAAGVDHGAMIPDSLRDVVLARAAQLDADAIAVLNAVSVGGSAPLDILEDLCDLTASRVAVVVDHLIGTALLVSDRTEVRFRHELGRETIDGGLAAGRRAVLHARWAASLERRWPERGRGDRPPLDGRRRRRAGIQRVADGGPGGAARRRLSRGRTPPDPCRRPLGAAGCSTCRRRRRPRGVAVRGVSGRPPRQSRRRRRSDGATGHRRARGDAAAPRGEDLAPSARPVPRSAPLGGVLGGGRPGAGRPPSLATDGGAGRGAGGCIVRPRLRRPAGRSRRVWLAGRRRRRGQRGQGRARHRARSALTLESELAGEPLDVAYDEATVAMCGPAVPPEVALRALNGLAHALDRVGRPEEFLAVAERGVQLARQHGIGGFCAGAMALYCIGGAADLGRWEDVESMVGELADLLVDPLDTGDLARVWGLVLARQGRLGEARDLMDAGRARLESGEWENREFIATAVVEFDALEGRVAAAARCVADVVAGTPAADEVTAEFVAAGVAVLADGVLATAPNEGRRAAAVAQSWIDAVERSSPAPWRAHAHGPIYVAAAKAHLGRLLGRPEPHRWAEIADHWAAAGFPWAEAHARMRVAEALLAGTAGQRRSARTAAAAELERARATAEGLGARPLLAAIDGLARRAGLGVEGGVADVAPPSRCDGFGLTRREHEVLALLAAGRTNGEIARALYISTKTASVHVSNILRKTGVANRVEAAALAGRAEHGAAGEPGRSLVDWLHEVTHGPGPDLRPVSDAVDHGVAEVEADQDPRLAVLAGGVGEAAERARHR